MQPDRRTAKILNRMKTPKAPLSRSENMSRIRGKDTKPEIIVRKMVHALGYRFRLHRRDLPGTPDLVFLGRKSVIFVHGCFWHRHAGCKNCSTPKTRPEFWQSKFDQNVKRDRKNIAELENLGWRVMTVWECEAEASRSDLKSKVTRFLEGTN